MRKLLAMVLYFLLAVHADATAAGAAADAARFAQAPAVTKDGAGAKIAFEAAVETDVAVQIEDAQGKVVRHLAAGRLGKNPPPPLQAGALKQELAWDGTDDAGKPAEGGPFKARVRLGLKPVFDGFLLYEPDASPPINAVAVRADGKLYAFYRDPTANGNQGGFKIRILDREAKYVKQILPFGADLPYEKVKATGAFQDEQGRTVPHCHNWHSLSFYPDSILARGRSMSEFCSPVAGPDGRLYWLVDDARLCCIDEDGGLPYETFLSEPIAGDIKDAQGGRPALALSGDGKALYVSGICRGAWGANKPVPGVWKVDLATRKSALFLGKVDEPGTEKDRFTAPRGLCVMDGLLFVADPAADRVAAFKESDGAFAGELKVTQPHIVQADPKTKALYVCSYVPEAKPNKDGKARTKDALLLKYADWKSGKETAKLALPSTGLSPNFGTHRIVLDSNAAPPLVWVPGLPYAKEGANFLNCYRDTGAAFEEVKLARPKGHWGDGPRDLLYDRAHGDLYVKVQGEKWYQFEEKTGKFVRTVQFPKNDGGPYMGSSGSQLGVEPNGDYITHCWGKDSGLMRWTRDLKPKKWDGQETHRTEWGGMMTFQLNYMELLGDLIYVIKPEQGPHHLDVYDKALKKTKRAVWNVRRGSVPRVDAQGNVYITVPIRPLDRDLPAFFDGKLEKIPDYFNSIGMQHYWYLYMHGSIVKFPARGGAFAWIKSDREKNDFEGLPAEVKDGPRQKFQYFQMGHYPHKTCEVLGAEWVRFGYSPYSETYPAGTPVCMCEGTGFDVDPYGRVFYPNLCQFRVEVIDTNNNEIGRFGRYGNQDAKDGPEPPLGWPAYVAVSDTHAYVSDTVGLRVVKVKLGYEADEAAEIK